MPRVNPQSRSVGNTGDVLKHAVLVELAALLAARGPVKWVETHAFLLHAPLADAARWEREIDALVAVHPAYGRYARLERDAMAQTGRYRCSSGLVLDVLGPRRARPTLGEADGRTRAELREQLAAERIADAVVADDAVVALREAAVERGTRALVHVDPFALPPETWSRFAPGLDAVCGTASDAVMVVYRYTRSGPTPWPAAPAGTIGPVAQIRSGTHELAAYASREVAEPVRATCGALGWRLETT